MTPKCILQHLISVIKKEMLGLAIFWKGHLMKLTLVEETLIQKAKMHDETSFSELMQYHGKSLYKIAKAILKNDDDVADAMQDTALTCWNKITTLEKEEYFKTWLIRILINNCRQIHRKKRQWLPMEHIEDMQTQRDDYNFVEWQELLNTLSKKYREVISLHYAEGFKVNEIAQILDISESTVKRRMAKAREKLKEIYEAQYDMKRRYVK